MVRNRCHLSWARLVSADIHIPVHLAAIGAYYVQGEVFSKAESKLAFPYSGGTDDSNHRLLATSFCFSRLLDNAHEFLGLEAGSANQGTIDLGTGNELSNISTDNAAAIKDAQILSHVLVPHLAQHVTNKLDSNCRLLATGRLTRAYSPNGLVGNNQITEGLYSTQSCTHLPADHLFCLPAFVLFKPLTDTQDRLESI